jgi:F420H(2)-dependent quinone reductase
MRLPKWVVRIANEVTKLALLVGIPRPPYTRKNALIIETVGRRSGKRYRIPVGYIDDGGRIIVVVEDGRRAHWVRNALANAVSSGFTSVEDGAMPACGSSKRIQKTTFAK